MAANTDLRHMYITDCVRDTFDGYARAGYHRQWVAAIKSHELVPSATAVC